MPEILPRSHPLQLSIDAYEAAEPMLRKKAYGKWVVFDDGTLLKNKKGAIGHSSFEDALETAKPCMASAPVPAVLIRRVGEEIFMRPGGRPSTFLPPKPNFLRELWKTLRPLGRASMSSAQPH